VFESGTLEYELRNRDNATGTPADPKNEGLHLHAAGKKQDGRWNLQFMSQP